MTDSHLWQREQCFLSITCRGENDIIGNKLMVKRNLILPSHESIRATCLGSDVPDLVKVENYVNNVTFYEAVTTQHHKVISGPLSKVLRRCLYIYLSVKKSCLEKVHKDRPGCWENLESTMSTDGSGCRKTWRRRL